MPKQNGRKSATTLVLMESGTTVISSRMNKLAALTIVTALTERSLSQRRRLLDSMTRRTTRYTSRRRRMIEAVRLVGR